MTRARERLVLSGAAKFSGWLDGSGKVGGGPVTWIAPAFVADLAAVVADGGGEVDAGGARLAVRIGRPDHRADAEPAPGDAAPAPAGDAGPSPLREGWRFDPRIRGQIANPQRIAGRRAPTAAALSYSSLQEYHRCGYRFYAERVLGLPSQER